MSKTSAAKNPAVEQSGAVRSAPEPAPLPLDAWADGSLSVNSAAKMLDTSPRNVFQLMKDNRLRWGRLGRARRIPKMYVTKLLASNGQPE